MLEKVRGMMMWNVWNSYRKMQWRKCSFSDKCTEQIREFSRNSLSGTDGVGWCSGGEGWIQ